MTAVQSTDQARTDFLSGGGELGRLIREFDWSQTSLGPTSSWSPALRTMVQFMLANRFPMLLWWGPEYVQMYNDPYSPIPGGKHPREALGQPGSQCWSEIWHIIGPLVDRPYHGGPSSWDEDILLELHRHGFTEESHFTIAYSPVPDESVPSGIGGVLATVHEITGKVVGERRVRALRDIGARSLDAKSAGEACAMIADTLSRYDKDIPFAAIYLVDPSSNQALLTGLTGVVRGSPVSPERIDLILPDAAGWPISRVLRSQAMEFVDNLAARFSSIPKGPWSDPPHSAVVVPIPTSKAQELAGFMIIGISARLRFDALYRDFVELLRTQVANAVSNARAYEEEKRRAEELAALDRAKTQFFSNVSHEFRTPLTLMLGPIENLLAGHKALGSGVAEQLEVVHRNSLRLLRLVNSMLEFTRIEAGRVSANYEAVDLPALTADLASNFRSACAQAGLTLTIDCPPLGTRLPAYVDRDMWEKIVLNLVSNAFKFTLSGEITVRVEPVEGIAVRLMVRDTGVGIPAGELPRMFERFHRIQSTRARTHEGTGIGLALVQELVTLHGGTIAVESKPDVGSTFTVTLPLGRDHLANVDGDYAEPRAGRTTTRAFVEEALHWLPAGSTVPKPAVGAQAERRARVLWADDNGDMRQYVERLLEPHFDVESVPDGQSALEAARERAPDLILADVMMPRLNGFELLQEVRTTKGLEHVPVILVSARAGEESRIGGMQAGADDYLVKPFSARELVARVQAHVRLARFRHECELVRRESEEQVSRLHENLRNADRMKDEFLATLAHELRNPLAPVRNAVAIINLKGSTDPELHYARGVIERQVEQMTRLVDDLLDVSRISRGTLDLRRERVELARVIHGAVEASRPNIEMNAHQLHVMLPAETIHLHADETRLIQVFCNLLNNAAKYSESRGRIVVSAGREAGDVVVTVRDHGIGMSDDVLPRVFDMFAQGDRGTGRSKGGLGVGLTLVKKLVELHNGSVEARSDGPGRGSEFIVRLPIVVESTEARRRSDTFTDREVPLMRQRVLVVDDNRDAADTLAIMLRLMGCEVRTAYDGTEALHTGADLHPDVVLLDIGLPGLNGYETARRIRREPWGSGTLLIALTGWGQSEDRRKSRESGFDHHVVKPVAADTLLELLAPLRGGRPAPPAIVPPTSFASPAEDSHFQ